MGFVGDRFHSYWKNCKNDLFMIETRFSGTYYLRNTSYNLGKVAGKVELSDLEIVVDPKANQKLKPNQTLSLLNFLMLIYSHSTIWHTVIVCSFIWNNLTLFRNILINIFFLFLHLHDVAR